VGRFAAYQSNVSSGSMSADSSRPVGSGDTLLISIMLTNTHSGAVSASDTQGNAYTVVIDQFDSATSRDRTVVLAAPRIKALTVGDRVTITFPTASEQHLAIDVFSGVTAIDRHSSNTGLSGASFNSGSPVSGSAGEIEFATAGVQGGENVAWGSGLTSLPTVFLGEDQLATAYRVITASGGYQATGNCDHEWMAGVVTLS
jgi:hypothetical protein